MKQSKINMAYMALKKMAGMELPVRYAYNIYMMTRALEPSFQFEVEQEKKLVDKYHGKVNDAGSVTFKEEKNAIGFQKELNEMQDMDVDVEIAPFTIQLEEISDAKMTVADFMSLEGMITFE